MTTNLPSAGRAIEELKRISRILEIIQMIAVFPKRYRRKDFANRYEISERMIGKDIQVIRHGLRLALQSSSQGYYFESIPNLPAVQFSMSEGLSLLMALRAAQRLSGTGSPELTAAVTRMESLFPADFAPFFRSLSTPPVMTAHGKHRQQMLILLNRALMEERKVRMTYATRSRGGAVSERVVHPYHLMPYVRSWQLIAYCELRDAVLMFKLDRIQEATLLDKRYQIPTDFELDSYLGWSWGIIRGDSLKPEEVVLLFEADTGHRVMEEEWHPSQEAKVLPDGRVKFMLGATITPEFVAWLLYYGSRVEVVKAEWLRKQVAMEHSEAAGVYQFDELSQEVE